MILWLMHDSYATIYYIKLSVYPSAFLPRQAAVSAWIYARLAQNESYVLWHLQVYF